MAYTSDVMASLFEKHVVSPRIRRLLVYPAFAVLLALVAGIVVAASIRRPQVLETLGDLRPKLATRLYDRDGGELRAYAREYRMLLPANDLPELLRDAVLAVEDARFYEHGPVDPKGILRAAWTDLRRREWAEGFSTISMQVARGLFLTREKTLRRKTEEVFLAVELEKRLTKDQILALYMNVTTNLGHGNYGFAQAARSYYGKSVEQLSLAEAATLAGIPRWPEGYDVYSHPERVLARRDHVLRRMLDEGRIELEAYEAARSEPLGVLAPRRETRPGAYFTEKVRRYLADRYGTAALYERGLVVKTSLDPSLQAAAEAALREQLLRLDPERASAGDGALQGAVVVLESATGAVRALVGGWDYSESEFDRATQGRRQVGSTFKTFVYGAALENGFTAADTLFDGPVTFPGADNRESYSPRNDSRRYYGVTTLRRALQSSINVTTVKLFDLVGAAPVIDFARRCGIRSRMPPYPTLALGAASLSPLELAAAYATIANRGTYVAPYTIERVETSDGRRLEEHAPWVQQAVDPAVAYVLVRMLAGVARAGTAAHGEFGLAGLPLDVAGKTGTTQAATDAWFAGMTPRYTIVAWVGYDRPRPLGGGMGGSRAALPIFTSILRRGLAEGWIGEGERFARPPGVHEVLIDPRSGLLAAPGTGGMIAEAFVEGSEPRQRLEPEWSRVLGLPWYLQEPFYLPKEGERMPREVADWSAVRESWAGKDHRQ